MIGSFDEYRLLDFGEGRKLEQFAEHRLDRPCPAADGKPCQRPELWSSPTARFTVGPNHGRWRPRVPSPWELDCQQFRLELSATPFGHVGVFPEQWQNWQWIHQLVLRRSATTVLNLFGYTGGSSLAAAAAGAQVTHVDAARKTVQWASRNAARSQLDDRIRWIVDDASRFVKRELKRGRRYDAIVLDPPSYGHGPKGEVWKLTSDLMPLLKDCQRLLTDQPAFVLLSCHTPGFGPAEVGASLQQTLFGHCGGAVESRGLFLIDQEQRKLPAGVVARVQY